MSVNNHVEILTKGTPPVPKLAIAILVVLAISVIPMVVIFSSKPGSIQEVTLGQEMIIGVDNATFYVPKNAVTRAGVITISPLKPNLYPDGSEWFRSQIVSVEYLNVDGTPYLDVTFPEPVLICFKIGRKQWQDYTERPDEYQVQYYAEAQDPPGWVALPLLPNPDRYQLCGQTDHLSIFALAVIPSDEIIPVTGATLTPTPTGFLTPTPLGTYFQITPTPTYDRGATPVSTQAALTATSVALTATDVPPTDTSVPPDTDTPVPDTPVPPDTDTPVPPDTDTPIPDTPIPDTPIPDTPIPDTPIPDTPIPDTPIPDTPEPDPTDPPAPTDPPTG